MSDYLSHILARMNGSGAIVRPRMGSRFENPAIVHPQETRASVDADSGTFKFVPPSLADRPRTVAPAPFVASDLRRLSQPPDARIDSTPEHHPPDPIASVLEPNASKLALNPVPIPPAESGNTPIIPSKTTPIRSNPEYPPPVFGIDLAPPTEDSPALISRARSEARRRQAVEDESSFPPTNPDSSRENLSRPPSPIPIEPAATVPLIRENVIREHKGRAVVASTSGPGSTAYRPTETDARAPVITPAAPPPLVSPPGPAVPTIHVTIGRVVIRAQNPAPSPPARRTGAAARYLSVDDYLQRRASRNRHE